MQAETALQQSKEHGHELQSKLEQTRKVWIAFPSFFSGFAIRLCFSWIVLVLRSLHYDRLMMASMQELESLRKGRGASRDLAAPKTVPVSVVVLRCWPESDAS